MTRSRDGTIFVSYRREDAPDSTRKLLQRLVGAYGRDRIVYDLDMNNRGQEFVEDVRRKLADCKLVIVVIGPNWASVTNEFGDPKINDSRDYTHTELAHALISGIPVISVLIDDGKIPQRSNLPRGLEGLAGIQSATLRSDSYEGDLELLERALDQVLQASEIPIKRHRQIADPPLRPRGTKVFISYRRRDTAGTAPQIYEALARDLPDDDIFLDLRSIELASDYRKRITAALDKSCLVIALIGRQWANPAWSRQRKWFGRWFTSEDLVQIELEVASDLRVPVLPVLVDGAIIPEASRLPAKLAHLNRLNAALVSSGPTFDADVEKVVEQAFHWRQQLA